MGVLAGPAIAVYVLWTDWRLLTRPWVLLMGWLLLLGLSGGWGNLISWILSITVGLPGRPVELAPSSAVILLVTLGLTVWALLRDRRNPLLYLGVASVLVGVSLNYVFLPMRAMQLPAINEGEPTSWQALLDVLNRVQYGKPSVMLRQADLQAQLAMYWQYFSWQFARDWDGVGRLATALFAVLGLSGLWTLLRRDRRAGIAAGAMLFTLTLALIFYLNFRYGYSIYPDRQGLEREVRERDYFFICSFAFFGTLVAAGLGAWIRGVAEFLQARAPGRSGWLAGLPLLALALVPLLGNRVTATRAQEFAARDFARDLLESVEPYGILITAGDNDTFPLWFAQEVEGIRPDVTLANLSLMNTDWHLRQLRRRQIPDFDPSKSLAMWKPGSDIAGVPLAQAQDPGLRLERAGAGQPARAGPGPRGQPPVRQPRNPLRHGGAGPEGPGGHLPDPRQPGQAAHLLQLERGHLPGPNAGPNALPGIPGAGAEALPQAGGG